MLHPSYTDLMNAVNEVAVETNDQPIVQSRYSIVHATAKRARQLISGAKTYAEDVKCNKPLSLAVNELYTKKVMIVSDENQEEEAE